MTTDKICTIRLLNSAYEIKCPEQEHDNLLLAAEKLNEHIIKKKSEFNKLDDFKALLLAALHVSHELITYQTQQQEQRMQLTEFISTLESKIGRVASSDIPLDKK